MRSTGKEGNTAFAAWKEACPALILKRLPAAAPAGVAPSPAPKQKQRRIPVEEVLTVNRVLWTANDSKVGLWGTRVHCFGLCWNAAASRPVMCVHLSRGRLYL